MKQIVIPEPGRVLVKNGIDTPERKSGEALLRILYCGICGSDLGTYRGTFLYSSYPRIPGHEFSAEVIEVDENEYGIKKGMIVTGNPYYNCGKCYPCDREHLNCCEHNETLGAQRDGIFQQYFSMPVERIYDGKGMDAKKLSLIEPFCISYHAVKRGGVKKGDKVLVVGAGTIGVLAALAAQGEGAEVSMSDLVDMRLEKARELGVTNTINIGTEDFDSRVSEITHGNGFDVCIECVGLPETFKNCIDAAAFMGNVVVVGIGKKSLDFKYSVIQTKELNVFGSRNALKADFTELIDRVNNGEFAVEKIISAEYGVDSADDAFKVLAENQDKLLKVLVDFQ